MDKGGGLEHREEAYRQETAEVQLFSLALMVSDLRDLAPAVA